MLAECGENNQLRRLSCEEQLERIGAYIQAVVLGVTWNYNSEDLFVREPTKVHHGGSAGLSPRVAPCQNLRGGPPP